MNFNFKQIEGNNYFVFLRERKNHNFNSKRIYLENIREKNINTKWQCLFEKREKKKLDHISILNYAFPKKENKEEKLQSNLKLTLNLRVYLNKSIYIYIYICVSVSVFFFFA